MDDIYLHHDDQEIGPFTEEKIRRYLEEGRIEPTTLGWVEGSDWKPIGEMLVNSEIVIAPPPLPQSIPVVPDIPPQQQSALPLEKKKMNGCIIASLVVGCVAVLSFMGVIMIGDSNGNSNGNSSLEFKGFHLGMESDEALRLINEYMKLPKVTSEPVAPKQVGFLGADKEGSYHIVKVENEMFIAKPDSNRPFALLDAEGKVTEIRVSTEIRNMLFDSEDSTLDEFMQNFIDNYGVPELEGENETINFMGNPVGHQQVYTHRSDKGFELKFYGERSAYDQQLMMEMGMLGMTGEAGSFTLKAIQTKDERSGKFD